MRETVEVLRPVSRRNAYGEAVQTWESLGAWHAERAKASGSLALEASEVFADLRATFLVRDGHEAKAGWRLVDCYGTLYEITAALRVRHRGILQLDCQKVNL